MFDLKPQQISLNSKVCQRNHILTMDIKQFNSFNLAKHPYFINNTNPLLALHPSSNFLAFNTRRHQVVVHNFKTGRSAIIHSAQQSIMSLLFTQELLIVVQKGKLQLLVFSLKTQKLKKKITGHRNQVTKLSYCEQKKLFASISYDVCILWSQPTLGKQKTLKCSTSDFIDCKFTQNGRYFFTVFKDSTVFVWNLLNFDYREVAFDFKVLGIAVNYSSYMVVYGKNRIQAADLSQEVLKFNDLDEFWDRTIPINNAEFLNENLVIRTERNLFIAEIANEHRIYVKKAKAISDPILEFVVSAYGSVLGVLQYDGRRISLMNGVIQKEGNQTRLKNPLTNQGLYCAGGYGNSQGCLAQHQLENYCYNANQKQLEQISLGTYKIDSPQFSVNKLQQFVRKHHILPQKHRALAYRYLLNLPVNPSTFKKYESLGRNQCVETLEAKYPLQNRQLAEAFKDVMSLLGHYSPIFRQADNVPAIVFPFVCLFGTDRLLSFDILYRLLTNWLSFLFKNFPSANADYVQNLQEIMEDIDIEILNHLKHKKLSFTKLCWGLISNLFTTVFPRQSFLAIIDAIFTRPNQPEITMFMVIGFLVYNRSKILKFQSDKDLSAFLENEQTVNTGKFTKIYTNLHEKYRRLVRYHFKQVDFAFKDYIDYGGYPRDAVRMYQGRRKLQTQQYRKAMDQVRYKEEIENQMAKMAIDTKRQAQKEVIQAQAYIYHSENQAKSRITLPNSNRSLRIERLKNLMGKLQESIRNNQEKKEVLKGFMPKLNCNLQETKDCDLQSLETNLMSMLTKFRPQNIQRPLHSQPIPIAKNSVQGHQSFKAAKNAQISNRLWQLNQIGVKNEQISWTNDALKSMQA